MIEEMQLRGLAPWTQGSYLAAVSGLARHYNRAPDLLSEEEVRSYYLHLVSDRPTSPRVPQSTPCATATPPTCSSAA